MAPSALAALARVDTIGFDLTTALAEGLTARTVEAAMRAGWSKGTVAGTADALARRTARGMLLARIVLLSIGLVSTFALVAAALRIDRRPGIDPAEAAIAKGDDDPPGPRVPKVDLHGDAMPLGAVARMGTIRHRQSSPIYRIACSADGRHLVTDGDDGRLRVWNATNGRLLRLIDPQVDAMSDFALTADGKLAMTAGMTLERGRGMFRNVTFAEIETGRIVERARWEESHLIVNLALAPDRRLMALGLTKENAVIVQDARTGAQIERVDLAAKSHRLAFSPDGRRLAIEVNAFRLVDPSACVIIRDVENGKEIRRIERARIGLGNFAFSPDGSLLAVPDTLEVGVWEVATGKELLLERALFQYLAFTADGRTLAGVSAAGRVASCDLAARHEVHAYDSGTFPTRAASLSPDGRSLAASGGPHVLHLWEIPGPGDRFRSPDAHAGTVNALTFTRDGKSLLSASDDRTVRMWDLRDGRAL